jgi:hypothetical protein
VVVEAFDAEFAAATDDWDDVFEELDPLLAPPTVERLSPSLRATCRLLLGKAYAERAMTEPEVAELAVQHIEAALADPALSALERWNAENALADVERRSGDHRRAAELLAAALARLDDGSGASSFGEAALQASLANLALERGDGRAALERTLVDLERAYDKFLVEWSTLPQRRDGVAFLHFGLRQAIVGAVVRLTIAVDDENGAKRALAQLLRAQALGSLSRALGGPPATLDEATRELCGPRRGVLVYLPGPERSFAFAHDSAKTTCTELAASRWWSSTRSDWFALLSHSPRRDGAERAKEHARLRTELAAQLLPERVLARLAEWDELSIVGIDLLGYTPFEALPLSDGQTLGTRLACTYLPSLAVGCQLARALEARSLPPASLCLVAAPTDPPAAREAGFKWDAIAWNDDHVEPLREIYGKEKLFVFTGDKASLAALASGAARTSASLQIVAHGFYQRLAQPPPGLALAPSAESNGLVRCQELEQLALPPLVVLAVCGAGRGPLRSGDDGVTNLGGACFKAGAVCVLISPIDLEQTATEKLLDLFHERFAAGETPARAMLAARRALAADPRFADPFYHSMLQVVGIGHRPLVR